MTRALPVLPESQSGGTYWVSPLHRNGDGEHRRRANPPANAWVADRADTIYYFAHRDNVGLAGVA